MAIKRSSLLRRVSRLVEAEDVIAYWCAVRRSSSAANDSDTMLRDAAAQIPPSLGSSGIVGSRFYKKAHMMPAKDGSGFSVMLDQRVLKTPARKPLTVPTPALALAIAAEWEWQVDIWPFLLFKTLSYRVCMDSTGIRPYTMPMMKLAATAIDQVPRDRGLVISSLLKYFHTDALCCRVEEPSRLAEKQASLWDPLLDWAGTNLGARPQVSTSIFVGSQPTTVVERMQKELEKANHWELAAIDHLAGVARSLVIALALSRKRLTVDQAIEAMRLEEDFQVQEWGLVEGGHDLDIADLRAKVYAGSVFLRLTDER